MSYYHLPTATERAPLAGEQRTDTGEWITPVDGQWADPEAALCGFLPITETDRPAEVPGTIAEPTVALVDGLPVRQWTVRPMTADELAAIAAMTEAATARDKLRTDLGSATTLTQVKTLLVAALDARTI